MHGLGIENVHIEIPKRRQAVNLGGLLFSGSGHGRECPSCSFARSSSFRAL